MLRIFKMKNIKIQGAGLSGLCAAINLAKAGITVDVYEKNDDCGKRFLGDLEGLENWSSKIDIIQELKSMNIKTNFDCNSFKKVYLSDGKQILSNTFKRPMFYIVKRGAAEKTLDQGVKKQALDMGVNIHFNSKTKKENMDIISTGTAGIKHIGIVKGIRFETDSDNIAVSLINNKASSSGYSYLLISNGYGCLCSVNLYLSGDMINKYYKKTYEIIRKQFDFNIKNEKNVGGIGCFLLKPRLIENNKIYTGEAAGLQDLLWGFGMRYAFKSGYLAAISIIENKNYKKLIKKNIYPQLKTSVVNRYLSDKISNTFYPYLINLAKKDKEWLKLLYKSYNPSLRSRVLYPFVKWGLTKKYKEMI